jgi:hypothetical protein
MTRLSQQPKPRQKPDQTLAYYSEPPAPKPVKTQPALSPLDLMYAYYDAA